MVSQKLPHDWVQNFRDYEAVLLCTHELPLWDADQTVRAFQTYAWADSTTPGDDAQHFTHEETSVGVLFDGSTLAIQYAGLGVGLERLADAFADLFPALQGLGWKRAEVYHPPETMDALLKDMGSAIPAHSDFDLVAASQSYVMSDDAYAVDTSAIGRRLLGLGAEDDASHAMRDEMREFGQVTDVSQQGNPSQGPIYLEDEGLTDEPIHVARPTSTDTKAQSFSGDYSHDDESPQVPSLAAQAPAVPAVAPVRELRFDAPVAPPKVLQPAVANPHSEPRPEQVMAPSTPPTVAALPLPMRPPSLQQSVGAPASITTKLEPSRNPIEPTDVLTLGASAFFFETGSPNAASLTSVLAFAQKHYDQVVHLQPGVPDAPIRWDFLGEIDPMAPALAERLAVGLGLGAAEAHYASATFLQTQSRGNALAQLRDALTPDPNDDVPYKHLSGPRRRDLHDAMLMTVAAHLLGCEEGSAFVDVRRGPDDDSLDTFSVRDVARSEDPRFFIVHVDPLDGPSVQRLADLLLSLVKAHQQTRRDRYQPGSNQDVTKKRTQEFVQIKQVLQAKMDAMYRAISDEIADIPTA